MDHADHKQKWRRSIQQTTSACQSTIYDSHPHHQGQCRQLRYHAFFAEQQIDNLLVETSEKAGH